MGHHVSAPKDYLLLQRHLDKNVVTAPYSPVFIKILQILFTPEQAALACKFPVTPTAIDTLARKLSIPVDELDGIVTDMAMRGLVFDTYHNDVRFIVLAPVVWGFFEFTFMRVRDDVPQAELATLFEQYLSEDPDVSRSIYQGTVPMTRSLVHENALPADEHTEILDYERATWLISEARAHSVSLCSCRHKASHLGKACDKPLEVCLMLNSAAEIFTRQGFAKMISKDRALRIVEECRDQGLAQSGDNIKKKISFICNCCSCCCELFNAIKCFNISSALVSSNWISQIDEEKCTGCGLCVKACPTDALYLEEQEKGDTAVKKAVVNKDICMGCGVCYSTCKKGAVTMKQRAQRVFTPENIFEKTVAIAIERKKLANYLFADPQKISHRALGRIVNILEHTSFVKAALAIKPLKSVFLDRVVKKAMRK